MPSFFFRELQTHHSFTFNLRFLYELKLKVPFSKTVCGIFYFRFHYVFYQSLYFYSTKCMDSLTLERHITPFKIKIIEKPHIVLLSDVWFLSWNKKLQNSMISVWVGVPQNQPGSKLFKPRKSKFWDRLNSNF